LNSIGAASAPMSDKNKELQVQLDKLPWASKSLKFTKVLNLRL
jgi:hypothetical protein